MNPENVRLKPSACLVGCLAVAILAMVSCGGVVDPSQNVTENFGATLTPASQGGGPYVFAFNVGKSGEYSISVTSTTPTTPNGIIGVGFGQIVGGACSFISLNALATVGKTGLAGAIQQGQWCAAVYDPGILTTATTFQANVKHP